jgi:hypothetical protein
MEVNPHKHNFVELADDGCAKVLWCSLCGVSLVQEFSGHDVVYTHTYKVGSDKPVTDDHR